MVLKQWISVTRFLLLNILLSVVTFSGASVFAQNRCEAVSSLSDGSFVAQVLNADLFFVGESHSETDSAPFLNIIRQFDQPSNSNCLILEADTSLTAQDAELITPSNLSQFSELSCAQCDIWRASVQEAFTLGWKVYAVDVQLKSYLGADASVQLRDHVMASRILKLWSAGTCVRGVAIVGKHHLMTEAPTVARIDNNVRMNRISLKTLLSSDLKVKAVNLIKNASQAEYENLPQCKPFDFTLLVR